MSTALSLAVQKGPTHHLDTRDIAKSECFDNFEFYNVFYTDLCRDKEKHQIDTGGENYQVASLPIIGLKDFVIMIIMKVMIIIMTVIMIIIIIIFE